MSMMFVPFGDWSHDGHGMYEKVLIEIEDTAALGKSVQFLKKKYGKYLFDDLANDYGCSKISKKIYQILEDNNYNFDNLEKTEYMTLPARFKDWKEYAQAQICEDGEEDEDEDEGGFSLESIEDIYFFLLRLGGAEFTIYDEIPLFTDETVGYGCFYD